MAQSKYMSVGVSMTPILTIDTKGMSSQRVQAALKQLEQDKSLHLNFIVIRDMVEEEHSPFVYFTDGKITLSHSRQGNLLTIYNEEYSLESLKPQNV